MRWHKVSKVYLRYENLSKTKSHKQTDGGNKMSDGRNTTTPLDVSRGKQCDGRWESY